VTFFDENNNPIPPEYLQKYLEKRHNEQIESQIEKEDMKNECTSCDA